MDCSNLFFSGTYGTEEARTNNNNMGSGSLILKLKVIFSCGKSEFRHLLCQNSLPASGKEQDDSIKIWQLRYFLCWIAQLPKYHVSTLFFCWDLKKPLTREQKMRGNSICHGSSSQKKEYLKDQVQVRFVTRKQRPWKIEKEKNESWRDECCRFA